jgi:hypothetical protein
MTKSTVESEQFWQYTLFGRKFEGLLVVRCKRKSGIYVDCFIRHEAFDSVLGQVIFIGRSG